MALFIPSVFLTQGLMKINVTRGLLPPFECPDNIEDIEITMLSLVSLMVSRRRVTGEAVTWAQISVISHQETLLRASKWLKVTSDKG